MRLFSTQKTSATRDKEAQKTVYGGFVRVPSLQDSLQDATDEQLAAEIERRRQPLKWDSDSGFAHRHKEYMGYFVWVPDMFKGKQVKVTIEEIKE